MQRLKGESGAMSLSFVILCMTALVLFMTVMNEYQSIMIIRNIEAAADLAAVESLRKYIDEKAVRNEALLIDADKDGRETADDMDLIRTDFINRIKRSFPDRTYAIVRVEIPEINGGEVVIPDDYANAAFFNSLSVAEGGTGFGEAVSYDGGKRVEYYLNGSSTTDSAFSIVRDNTNLATSDSDGKTRTSYFLTAKVLIIYRTTSTLNSFRTNILNYVDILSDEITRVDTQQLDPYTTAVTIQAIGKVTLR